MSAFVSSAVRDEFALRSHRLAAAAWDEGFFDDLVAPHGVAAICIGVGQGLAVVLENVEVAG